MPFEKFENIMSKTFYKKVEGKCFCFLSFRLRFCFIAFWPFLCMMSSKKSYFFCRKSDRKTQENSKKDRCVAFFLLFSLALAPLAHRHVIPPFPPRFISQAIPGTSYCMAAGARGCAASNAARSLP
jgi:hypothetical protein